ncbi:uncharacterized protein Z519_03036 [Cladophialophora bantiana CBS 173.52]|uniref:Enoyl reductase (ER) domain-containing protein n=1 Tax=Cladophialophora bantiana (strain ATCC 10958 / CBS 173.52 / CDC B-1940 / NIH 8579) TaxID=1442370 RepID=A0A0D2HYH8_CLAB1|nr:uncharacterized protein Z519_03036 [Cladophialophora bantiana CBS 173.52]KIW95970.1 hypothetical protein Z519_03036 [Cladophialophora bantiana CBS 173.52]
MAAAVEMVVNDAPFDLAVGPEAEEETAPEERPDLLEAENGELQKATFEAFVRWFLLCSIRFLHRYVGTLKDSKKMEVRVKRELALLDNLPILYPFRSRRTKYNKPANDYFWRKVKAQVPVPSAPEDGFLIKVHAAGICHSDYTLLASTLKRPGFPDRYTLGHEGAGEIVQIGEKVTSDLKIGDMVAVLSVPGCAAPDCADCSRDLAQLCTRGQQYGLKDDGSFAAYVAIKAHAAVPIPQGVAATLATSSTDALMTPFNAIVNRAKLKKGETVLILGIGGLGFNALQLSLWLGANVYVLDKRQEVLERAIIFGVQRENTFTSMATLSELIASKNILIDTVVDFVGNEELFITSQSIVRRGGTIVVVGIQAMRLSLDNATSLQKQLNILYSFGGSAGDVKKGLKLIAEGVVKPQIKTAPLSEFPRLVEDLHDGRVESRMVLIPDM